MRVALASPSRHQGRRGGRGGHPAGGAGHRARRSAASRRSGMMSNYLRALPAYGASCSGTSSKPPSEAGVDALVAVYHADHRELCAHERDYPFRIMNLLEIVGDSMGIHHDDHFKRLKLLQDVDAIAADCQDLMPQHGLDAATTAPGDPGHAGGAAAAAAGRASANETTIGRAARRRVNADDRAAVPSPTRGMIDAGPFAYRCAGLAGARRSSVLPRRRRRNRSCQNRSSSSCRSAPAGRGTRWRA